MPAFEGGVFDLYQNLPFFDKYLIVYRQKTLGMPKYSWLFWFYLNAALWRIVMSSTLCSGKYQIFKFKKWSCSYHEHA